MKQVRAESEYFRVGFYGKGFPSSVRVSVQVKTDLSSWVRISLVGPVPQKVKTSSTLTILFYEGYPCPSKMCST